MVAFPSQEEVVSSPELSHCEMLPRTVTFAIPLRGLATKFSCGQTPSRVGRQLQRVRLALRLKHDTTPKLRSKVDTRSHPLVNSRQPNAVYYHLPLFADFMWSFSHFKSGRNNQKPHHNVTATKLLNGAVNGRYDAIS